MQREPISSNTLQKKFPELYKKFFSYNTIVVSSPGSFFWSGEYAYIYGGMAIKQTIPLRSYVGLKARSSRNKVQIDKIFSYHIQNGSFALYNPHPIKRKKVEKLISDFLKEKGNEASVSIDGIIEMPPNCGMSTASAFCSALSVALHLLVQDVKAADIEKWNVTPIEDLLKNDIFIKIYSFACKMESIFYTYNSPGPSSFTSLVGSHFPILFFMQPRFSKEERHKDHESSYDYFKEKKFWGARLDEICDLSHINEWPIDFCLIHSGNTKASGSVLTAVNQQGEILAREFREIKSDLERAIKTENAFNIFLLNNGAGSKDLFWIKKIQNLALLSLETFHSLKALLSGGLDSAILKTFFHKINAYHDALRIIGVSTPKIDYMRNYLQYFMSKSSIEHEIASKITGSGQGGDILLVMPAAQNSGKLMDLIDGLSEKEGDIHIDYASWIDGFEPDGLRIEQNIIEKIYSDHISPNSVQAKHLNAFGHLSLDLFTYEDFLEKKKGMDLLLDSTENKIYIAGKLLDSKKIRSATATIGLMKILMTNFGNPVSNTMLPNSSYAQDRNELQSKILTPLAAAIKNILKRHLDLKITGGLRNFHITLGSSGMDIYLVEKIF